MDLDGLFVSALLQEGPEAVRKAIEAGVDGSYLKGNGANVFKFIIDYQVKYKAYPTPEIVTGSTGISILPPAPAPASFFTDELLKRRLHKAVGDAITKVLEQYEAMKPEEAYLAYEQGLKEIRKSKFAPTRTVPLSDLVDPFLEFYDKIEQGYRGILTPWETINEQTYGFWPEDLVLFVARLGVGKTVSLILMADYAWEKLGKRVLFCTTEMSQLMIMRRWVSMHYRFPLTEIQNSTLDSFTKQKMQEGLAEIKERGDTLRFIGGDFDFRVESLDAAIEECEPEVVFMDGAYLLKSEGKNRSERASNSYDEMKRCAKRNKVPIISTTQFNREVKPNKAGSIAAEKIALSDAAGWNGDLIYGMIRTEDMERDNRMLFRTLKIREGKRHDVEMWWNFVNMDFSELPKGAQAALTSPVAGAGKAAPKPAAPDPYGAGLFDHIPAPGDNDAPDEPDNIPF